MISRKRSLLKESRRLGSLEGEWTSISEILDSVCSCIDPIDKHRVKLTAEKNRFLTRVFVFRWKSLEPQLLASQASGEHWYRRMS